MEDVWSLWSSLRPWITWAWAWIKANHEPLTVVVTFLGVLVAWRYVVLTRRLAEAANVQAGAAREQAEAGRIAANAAAEQARVTRQLPIGLTPNAAMGSVAKWAGPIFPSP
jgi:hypothetical protein